MGKCHNCDQYDFTTHNCPIFCDVIRNTLDDIKDDQAKRIFELFYEKAREQGVYSSEYIAFVNKIRKIFEEKVE